MALHRRLQITHPESTPIETQPDGNHNRHESIAHVSELPKNFPEVPTVCQESPRESKHILASASTITIPEEGTANADEIQESSPRDFSPCSPAMDSVLISPLPLTHVSSLVLQPSPFECIVYDIIDEDIPRPPLSQTSHTRHPDAVPPTLASAFPDTPAADSLYTSGVSCTKTVHLSPVSSSCTPCSRGSHTAPRDRIAETESSGDDLDDGTLLQIQIDSHSPYCGRALFHDPDPSVDVFDSTRVCDESGAHSRSAETAPWPRRSLLPSLQESLSAQSHTTPAAEPFSPSLRETGKYGPLRY